MPGNQIHRPDPREEVHDHDRGLQFDLQTLFSRRRALGIFGAVGLAATAAACGTTATGSAGAAASSASTGSSAATGSSATTGSSGSQAATDSGTVTEVQDETAGPYPGDGSNGPNVLDDSGIVRSDITASFGSSSTVVDGVPLTVALTVKDVATSSAMVGAAVYLWHCDPAGKYSLYDNDENYLRGVQSTDATGTVTFTSVFPACYSGRWPHIHFEVYADEAAAVSSGPIVKTSQIALPQASCEAVYADSRYAGSTENLSRVNLQSDNVFGNDGGVTQLATMSGDVTAGYTAALTVGV